MVTGGGSLSISGLGIRGISSLTGIPGKIVLEVFYLDYVHPLRRTQVSDGRNASFIMEIFLAAVLSCADGKWILDGLADVEISGAARSDIVLSVIESMPNDCPPGSYRGEGKNRS